MPCKRHHEFELLPLDTPLWRYMDFTKFVAMLASKSLYFSRVDRLDDAFEGAFPTLQQPSIGFFRDDERRRYVEERRKSKRDASSSS